MSPTVSRSAFLIAILLLPAPVACLERVAQPLDDDAHERGDAWTGGCSTNIAYYNVCNGWIWAWSGWEAGERIGVCYPVDWCGDYSRVFGSWHYAVAGNPSGYGYTGSMSLVVGNATHCPAFTMDTQPILPAAGWNFLQWNAVPPPGPEGMLLLWTNGPVAGPVAWATEHPGGCDVCYPSSRVVNSYRFGTASDPACPGLLFQEPGACAAELIWDVEGFFIPWGTVSVDPASWGSVKALYR